MSSLVLILNPACVAVLRFFGLVLLVSKVVAGYYFASHEEKKSIFFTFDFIAIINVLWT